MPPWADGDGPDDRQPQTRASRVAGPARVAPVEALEGSGRPVGVEAGAGVANLHHAVLAAPPGRDGDRRVARGVDEGVAHEVGHHLAEAVLVAVDDDASLGRGSHRPAGRHGACVGGGVDREHPEVDGLSFQRPALVEPGQQEEVVDELSHPPRLGLGAPHRLVAFRGVVESPAAVQLRVAADGRHRRPQLVRGVGDELPEPFLRRLLIGERPLQPGEHRVQRLPELSGLGAGGSVGHPLGEIGATRDGRGGPRHRLERAHAEPQDPERHEAEDGQDDRGGDDLDGDQPPDGGVDVVERDRSHADLPVVAGGGAHPEPLA